MPPAMPATHDEHRGTVACFLLPLLTMQGLRLHSTRAGTRPAVPARRASVRCCALFGLFNKSEQEQQTQASMGNLTSSSGQWRPGTGQGPRRVSRSGFDVTPMTTQEREAAGAELPEMAKFVTLNHGTEYPWTGQTVNGYGYNNKKRGTYVCALGGNPLFHSDTKFDSGTGWPSFYAPVDKAHIIEKMDWSVVWMPRVEVLCAKSGAHLGHVFDDGPAPTYKRYCINAAALAFVPEGEPLPNKVEPVQSQKAAQGQEQQQ